MNNDTSGFVLIAILCFALIGSLLLGGFILIITLSSKKNTSPQSNNKPATSQSPTKPAKKKISDIAIEHFDRAIDLWNDTDESKRDDNLRRDICAELALAINKAGAPFPRAHALLAMFFNYLDDDVNAGHHANVALQQNPNEFRAQAVRIELALKNVRITKIKTRDVIEWGGNVEQMIFGTVGKAIAAGIVSDQASRTQTNFKNEVINLVKIFRKINQTNTDVDEFLMMADRLIVIGDFIKDMPMPGGRPNLHAEIVNATTDALDKSGRIHDVINIRRKAEGRSLLFKP